MSNSAKLILITLFAGLLLAQSAFALQEVAGPLVISVPIGGSNSARWGLVNDGNQTIIVSLNATGNAAQYLSFPQSVGLQPGKIYYVNVTANIPANFDTSSGRNITGTLYALQKGQSGGQVQINVQMLKSLTITVTGESAELQQTSIAGNFNSAQASPAIGLAALFASNYLALVLLIALIFVAVIFIAFAFFVIKKSKQNPSKP